MPDWRMPLAVVTLLAGIGSATRIAIVILAARRQPMWIMIQIAMLCGFATAWPVNAWLIRKGIKEAM